MLRTLSIFTIVFLTLGSAVIVQADNLVSNPGFETGDLTGWTLSGVDSSPADNSIYYGVDSQDAHSGLYGAYFGPVGGVLDLSQTLALTAGANYTVSFWVQESPDTPAPYVNSMAVSLGGTALVNQTGFSTAGYREYSYSAVGTMGSSALTFAFRDDTGFFSLDDISVASNSIPEPASFLLLAPLLAVSVAIRLRTFAKEG